MIIIKTILAIIGIILLAVLIILILLLIMPFKYRLELYDDNEECYGFNLNYLILKLKAELRLKPKFYFKLTLLNKALVDTTVKKKKTEKNSIEDTNFIKHKGLEKEINVNKGDIRKLFQSAKKSELVARTNTFEKLKPNDKEKKKLIKNTNSLLDKFKNLLPRDFIYVVKCIVIEGINALDKIKPTNCKIDIKYSDKDPYSNGIMMSFAAPLYAVLGDKLKLRAGDKGRTLRRLIYTGRPVLITLFGPILSLLFDKKVRAFIFKKK